mgnify:CR=1 FL=1
MSGSIYEPNPEPPIALHRDEELFLVWRQSLPDIAGQVDLDLVIRAGTGIDQAHVGFRVLRFAHQT